MGFFRFGTTLIIMTVTAGCATMRIRSAHDPIAIFPTTGTFAWAEANEVVLDDPRLDMAAVDARIHRAVEDELIQKGYTLGSPAEATFLVGYHIALQGSLNTQALSDRYGYALGWTWGTWDTRAGRMPGRGNDADFERGTLVLDIISASTKRLIWRASAQAELTLDVSDQEKQRRTREAARRMLERFPPQYYIGG